MCLASTEPKPRVSLLEAITGRKHRYEVFRCLAPCVLLLEALISLVYGSSFSIPIWSVLGALSPTYVFRQRDNLDVFTYMQILLLDGVRRFILIRRALNDEGLEKT
jgi:hypothetical protein